MNVGKSGLFGILVLPLVMVLLGCNSGANDVSSDDADTSEDSESTSSTSLYISLSSSTVSRNGTVTLLAGGGTSPYYFSLYSGSGSVSGDVYTAGSTAGSYATIEVTDSEGSTAYGTIYTDSTITLNLSSSTISAGGTVTLSASGGTAPYTYSLVSGGGSISEDVYTAPEYGTTATIQVADAQGAEGTASVTVKYYSPLVISPSSIIVYTGDTRTFSASGGTGTYSYALISGGGSLSGAVYTAPSYATTAQVEVWDSNGNNAIASITVIKKTTLYAAATFQVDANALLAVSIPNSESLYPAFAIGGAGSGGDFGRNVTNTSTTSFAAAPASAAVALTNFMWSDSYPYVGTLVVSGRSGTNTFSFCIQAGDQDAHLKKVSVNQTLSATYKSIAYGSFAENTSGGVILQGLWIENIDTANAAGSASIQVQGGAHNHQLSDCSNYSEYTLLSASSL